MYYYIVVLASALGKQDVTATYTDKMLAICKEHRLYYETNELYRIRFSESLTVDKEQAYYFLQKMEQFATFTEDATEQSLAQLMRILYVIHVQKDYDAALMLANSVAYSDVPFYREIVEHSIQGIKGMLHYVGLNFRRFRLNFMLAHSYSNNSASPILPTSALISSSFGIIS